MEEVRFNRRLHDKFYLFADMRAYSKKYRQCSLHDVKCLRDNRRKIPKCSWQSFSLLFSFSIFFIFISLYFDEDVFSSLKPPDNIAALNESSIGMECVCPPTCSELVYIISCFIYIQCSILLSLVIP